MRAPGAVHAQRAGPVGRLPASVKVLYGIGDVAITASVVLFGLFILFFYTTVMKLPATLVGIASAVGLIWDAVIDPYIGYRSDNTRGRFGRRHGYMLVGALTMGASFWLLMAPPADLSPAGTFMWLLVTTLLFRFTSALYRIPYLGLGAELSEDYHERTAIVGLRAFFGLCGTLGAASLSFLLFFPGSPSGADARMEYANYPRMGLAFGAAMTVTALVATFGTLGARSAGAPVAAGPQQGMAAFLSGFFQALGRRSFRAVWVSFTLFFLAVVLNAALGVHYFTWYARIADSQAIGRIQAGLYVGALAGLAGWVWLARRAEKRGLCIIAMTATAGLMALASALFGEGRWLGTDNAAPLLIGHVIAGVFVSAVWVLPPSMMADVADDDELHTGLRREGLLFGALNFGEKVAAAVSLLLGGVLLDTFVGLSPGQAPDAAAAGRIGLLYGVLPAGIVAVAAVVLLPYSLDCGRVETIQAELRRRRGAGVPAAPVDSHRGLALDPTPAGLP